MAASRGPSGWSAASRLAPRDQLRELVAGRRATQAAWWTCGSWRSWGTGSIPVCPTASDRCRWVCS